MAMNPNTPSPLRQEDFLASLPWRPQENGTWLALLVDTIYSFSYVDGKIHLLRDGVALANIHATVYNPVRFLLRWADDADDRVFGELSPVLLRVAPTQVIGRSFTFTKHGDLYGLSSRDRHPALPSWCREELKAFTMKADVFVAALSQGQREPDLFIPVAPNMHVVVTVCESKKKYSRFTVYFDGKLHYSGAEWNCGSPATLADLLDQLAAVRASCMEDGVFVREAPPDLNFTSLPSGKTGPAIQETT